MHCVSPLGSPSRTLIERFPLLEELRCAPVGILHAHPTSTDVHTLLNSVRTICNRSSIDFFERIEAAAANAMRNDDEVPAWNTGAPTFVAHVVASSALNKTIDVLVVHDFPHEEITAMSRIVALASTPAMEPAAPALATVLINDAIATREHLIAHLCETNQALDEHVRNTGKQGITHVYLVPSCSEEQVSQKFVEKNNGIYIETAVFDTVRRTQNNISHARRARARVYSLFCARRARARACACAFFVLRTRAPCTPPPFKLCSHDHDPCTVAD